MKKLWQIFKALLIVMALVLAISALHFPILKKFINYGNPKLSEEEFSHEYYKGDNIRYFQGTAGFFEKDFLKKFSRPFSTFTCRFQYELAKYKKEDFPKYYAFWSQFYPYPAELPAYYYTGALISKFFPASLFNYKFPRLTLINFIIYILVMVVLFKIFRLYFNNILSFVFVVFFVFDVCLVYISYYYNSHTLCGILYFLMIFYIFLSKKRDADKKFLEINIQYLMLGVAFSFMFFSSRHFWIMIPFLVTWICLDLVLQSWRIREKILCLQSFCLGFSLLMIWLLFLEYLLEFSKYGMFTLFNVISVTREDVPLFHLGIPETPPIFLFYNFRYYNDMKITYLFVAFVIITMFLLLYRKTMPHNKTTASLNDSLALRLLNTPHLILFILLINNIILSPVVKTALSNRNWEINNFIVVMIMCFAIGWLSRFYFKDKWGKLSFGLFLTVILFLFMANFYCLFGKGKIFARKKVTDFPNSLNVSNNKELLAKRFDKEFYDAHLAGKYKYISFHPRFIYEEIGHEMRQSYYKKTFWHIEPESFREKYLLIESLLQLPIDPKRIIVKSLPKDATTYGLGYLDYEYFSYYVLMEKGRKLIDKLKLGELSPNKFYSFNIENFYSE